MHRNSLLAQLDNYIPADEHEMAMCLKTKNFIAENPACFERSLLIGHVTASAWVISPDYRQVLLMHHAKLDKWFQPGGHCDGDPDVLRVAIKEAEEETGVRVRPIQDEIFDVDVHPIPATSKVPAHWHYDIRFLLEADPTEEVVQNSESKAVRWISLGEVEKYNASESLLRMQRKTSISI
jgi:8-oxo-dGTP pyrophosphatase MutT (NUDIX family)